MQEALRLAEEAARCGEVPVGAVIVCENQIIGRGFNQPISTCDPTAHAEIMALRDAGLFLKNYRLPECDLYVTLEPCLMCVGALIHARIRKLIFAAHEPKTGSVRSAVAALDFAHHNHRIEIAQDVEFEAQSQSLLRRFFEARRNRSILLDKN
ncbi:MAG: tRNA-specific adenosine deaminase [Gammaproteobacteria bacterium]|nr:tRNA-specific adenosine deaminase [Gammaproteobacteria bacterium]